MAQKEILVYADWKGVDKGCKIGVLHCVTVRSKEIFSFEYDKEWISSGKYNLLDPDLKLLSGPQYVKEENRNFGLFLDSSPDRWGRFLLNRKQALVARQKGIKSGTLQESDYLLGVHDILRMGGLRFKLDESGPFLDDDRGISIPPLAYLRELEEASLHIEDDESFDDPGYSVWLNILLAPGSSIGGARPKACVADTNGELWIAKFPSRSDLLNTGAWEWVTWELAKRSGLNVPESTANTFSKKGHTFMTKRFDRTAEGGRIHFASAMTLLGYNDGTDYKDGASYLDIAEFLIQNGSDVNADLEEVWRRIVFSICVKNTDDHLRNHGFLLTENGWKLSPAYDINPNPRGNGLTLNISLNENSLDLELAMEVRPFFRISDKRAKEITEKVKKAVSFWKPVAEKLAISKHEMDSMSRAFLKGGNS